MPLHPGNGVKKLIRLLTVFIHKNIPSGGLVADRRMNVHGATRLILHWLGHEGCVHFVVQRRLSYRTLEQKSLIGQIHRRAMVEIDLHLRCPRLMAQRVDIKPLHITMIIDFLEKRIKFIYCINAIGLACLFGPARFAGWGNKGVVGIRALLDKKKFQLRGNHGLKARLIEQRQNARQNSTRCEWHNPAVMVDSVMDNLCRRLHIPRNQTTGCGVRPQHYISADFIQNNTVIIFACHRLAENIFRQTQATRFNCRNIFMYRQDFTPWNARNIAH